VRIGTIACCALLASADASSAQQRQVRVSRTAGTLRNIPDSVLRAGVPILSARGVDTTRVAATGFQLDQGTFAALQTGERIRVVPGPLPARGPAANDAPFLALPIRLVTPDATLSGTWVLRPVFKVATRLRWEPDSGVFRGAIFLAVEDSLRRSESRPLPTPVRFQLLAEADRVQPDRIELKHTNFPLQRIDVATRNVSDSMRLQIVPEFDLSGVEVWLPVEPSLVLQATPRRIQGWGVGSARVSVRVIGASARARNVVGLTASNGDLETDTVTTGGAAIGSTRLRSSGIGPVTVTATAPGFSEAVSTIEFVWPIFFLLAALLGGVFGGLAAAAQNKKGRRRARWAEFAMKGVFAGGLAALAWYALGVNLLDINVGMPRFNELAVFAFAALAGYFGIPRLGGRVTRDA
jgi:hypothetical protein